mmetsp:Transcript_48422/g.55717  ORF Transcript_48422/g.55717 Transcript_48422/m.55717 type:complete len:230 (+) Transcript_48422:92-781(+)
MSAISLGPILTFPVDKSKFRTYAYDIRSYFFKPELIMHLISRDELDQLMRRITDIRAPMSQSERWISWLNAVFAVFLIILFVTSIVALPLYGLKSKTDEERQKFVDLVYVLPMMMIFLMIMYAVVFQLQQSRIAKIGDNYSQVVDVFLHQENTSVYRSRGVVFRHRVLKDDSSIHRFVPLWRPRRKSVVEMKRVINTRERSFKHVGDKTQSGPGTSSMFRRYKTTFAQS